MCFKPFFMSPFFMSPFFMSPLKSTDSKVSVLPVRFQCLRVNERLKRLQMYPFRVSSIVM